MNGVLIELKGFLVKIVNRQSKTFNTRSELQLTVVRNINAFHMGKS